MEYCTICGFFTTDDKHIHYSSDCFGMWGYYTEKKRKVEMLPVTMENLFCGKCNKIFSKDTDPKICPHCGVQPLFQITDNHLKNNNGFVLLSGLAGEKVFG